MPVIVGWESQAKTILLYTFEGRWTWKEFSSALTLGHGLIESVDYPVNIIVDTRHSHLLPSGAISYIRRLPSMKHPRTGVTVMVGASKIIRALYQVVVILSPGIEAGFLMVNSFEEAYEALAQREA